MSKEDTRIRKKRNWKRKNKQEDKDAKLNDRNEVYQIGMIYFMCIFDNMWIIILRRD